MPTCRVCLKVQPTAEVRRAPHGHICKDKLACESRVERNDRARPHDTPVAARAGSEGDTV